MITHVSFVEMGVYRYPKGFEGWRFYRIEYFDDVSPFQIREDCLWLPPGFDVSKLEDEINEQIKGDNEES